MEPLVSPERKNILHRLESNFYPVYDEFTKEWRIQGDSARILYAHRDIAVRVANQMNRLWRIEECK